VSNKVKRLRVENASGTLRRQWHSARTESTSGDYKQVSKKYDWPT